MYRTFINSFKVSFAENANSFIYFLKRLPILGKKFPDSLYGRTNAKLTLGIIKEILAAIGKIFGKALYLGVMILLPAYLIYKDTTKLSTAFFQIFFFLSFIAGPLIHSVVFETNNKQAFNMIRLLRCNPGEYYISKMLYLKLTDLIYFLLPLMITGAIIGVSPLKALMLLVEMTAFRFIGEWLHLFVYDKSEIVLLKKNSLMYIVMIGGLAITYGLPYIGFTLDFQAILSNIFVFLIIIALGAFAFKYIWRYEDYMSIARSILNKENLFDIAAIKTNAKFATVKLNEEKFKAEELSSDLFGSKTGYEYLNSLFFLRHRSIMITPVKTRCAVIGVVFLIAMFVVLFIPSTNVKAVNLILKGMPSFVFIMYIMSTGERICKAMFYNCDISLLRYAYYREGRVILSNFTSRLKRVVLLNVIPAAALCMAIAIVVIAAGSAVKLPAFVPEFLSILSLACFFSIHHLVMYYVIQPYTADLMVKSPLYKIMNFIIYLISYASLQIKTTSYYFTYGVLIVTLIYMSTALVITYRVAPKTFKLR